ncbi:MAG: RHS repeat-associated core domain-containing protein, partial [Deltaproteobacteria bacterium]|nr:RHS repeat-associated core domain-containing protein [Deltaproteobacteria bacterium]
RGSPRLVVNTATGAVAQRMDYDAFGVVTRDTSPGFQPFGFAGGLWDREVGLVRFGVRDYDPQAGRWTARDPMLFGGDRTNLYRYVGNDPINNTDPSGKVTAAEWAFVAIMGVMGAIIGGFATAGAGGTPLQILAGVVLGALVGVIAGLLIVGALPLLATAGAGAKAIVTTLYEIALAQLVFLAGVSGSPTAYFLTVVAIAAKNLFKWWFKT